MQPTRISVVDQNVTKYKSAKAETAVLKTSTKTDNMTKDANGDGFAPGDEVSVTVAIQGAADLAVGSAAASGASQSTRQVDLSSNHDISRANA